jgi:hypothetical protein
VWFKMTLEEHQTTGLALRGGLQQEVQLLTPSFANDRCCALGRWIDAREESWSDFPEFLQLKIAHASFHTIALVVAIAVKEERYSEAATLLEPESLFESVTSLLTAAVRRLEDKVLDD